LVFPVWSQATSHRGNLLSGREGAVLRSPFYDPVLFGLKTPANWAMRSTTNPLESRNLQHCSHRASDYCRFRQLYPLLVYTCMSCSLGVCGFFIFPDVRTLWTLPLVSWELAQVVCLSEMPASSIRPVLCSEPSNLNCVDRNEVLRGYGNEM
jgi:hypothetical protein